MEIRRISVPEGVIVFQNTPFKNVRSLRWNDRREKMKWLFVFKIKQKMFIVTPN